jgi:hypothetical protein
MSVLTMVFTARKDRPCATCDEPVRAGERYILTVITPGDPVYENDGWLRYAQHLPGTRCRWTEPPVNPEQGMAVAATLGYADAEAGQRRAHPAALWARLQRATDRPGYALDEQHRGGYELAYCDAYDTYGTSPSETPAAEPPERPAAGKAAGHD